MFRVATSRTQDVDLFNVKGSEMWTSGEHGRRVGRLKRNAMVSRAKEFSQDTRRWGDCATPRLEDLGGHVEGAWVGVDSGASTGRPDPGNGLGMPAVVR